jgi:hypothetical protein
MSCETKVWSGQAKRLEPDALDRQIGGLAFSPDDRYLLFCSNRRNCLVA